MKNLGRFTVSATLLAALMALPCVCAASDCAETAATNYAIAVAIDYPAADMVVENTIADCEADVFYTDDEFRQLRMRAIAADPRPDHRRWLLEALEFGLRCPNGYYDAANDVDVCE